MARYSDDSKERVRDAVDMVDLVSTRTELRRAGTARYSGRCPFHEERTPSFSVNPAEKLYYCFGCGAKGDAFTFVQETEGLDFVSAMEHLANRYGVTLEVVEEDPQAAERRRRRERLLALLERAALYYQRHLWESDEAEAARAYLSSRGLAEEVLREFRVGFAPNAWDRLLLASRRAGFTEDEVLAAGLARRGREKGTLYDPFRGRIVFPLADGRGRVLGFGARAMRDGQGPKYVNTAEGEVFHKGRQLYGADRARAEANRSGEVVLAEGYTDVIALHQAGVRNAVGVMGTSLTEAQVDELARLVAHAGGARLLLALDADKAGQEAMVRAAKVAAGRKLELRVVQLPIGADPADLLGTEGPDVLRERFAASVPFVRFQVERALASQDITDAEGKDRVLATLAPVLGAMAPSALREELVALTADRLGLAPDLVVAVLGGGARPQPAAAPAAAAREHPPTDGATKGRERVERTFLTLCIALPEAGAARLAALDLDTHFTSPLVRRAAAHLAGSLADPMASLPDDDDELAELMAGLVARAERLRSQADVVMLEVEALQLELGRLERDIAKGGLVAELAAARQQVRERIAELSAGIS